MPFSTCWKIRFADVDPASIVFYPRYFEMLNGAVEDWFETMGYDFSTMHRTLHRGVPTVRIESQFLQPSELGDVVDISITPTRVGESSCTLDFLISCNGIARVKANSTLVYMDLDAQKSCPWPEDLRQKLIATQTGHEVNG